MPVESIYEKTGLFLLKIWEIQVIITLIMLTRSSERILNPCCYTGYRNVFNHLPVYLLFNTTKSTYIHTYIYIFIYIVYTLCQVQCPICYMWIITRITCLQRIRFWFLVKLSKIRLCYQFYHRFGTIYANFIDDFKIKRKLESQLDSVEIGK